MKLAGKLAIWIGGLVFISALFVNYYGPEASLWDVETRGPLLYTLLALVAVTLAVPHGLL